MPDRQTVLVTGGAKRLGRAIALRLAQEGYDLAIHYNTSSEGAESLRDAVVDMGRTATLFSADVADAKACQALVRDVASTCNGLVGLVNSASVFEPDTLETMTEDFYRHQMAVNAEAPLFLTQAFHAAIEGRGWVVNMIDCKIFQLTPDFFAYTLSKLALQNITTLCAMACAPKLRVNGVAPGLVLRSGNQTQETFEREHDRIPLRVGPTPEHIADTVSLLARAESTTGQIIAVDGGRQLYTPADLAARFEVPPLPGDKAE